MSNSLDLAGLIDGPMIVERRREVRQTATYRPCCVIARDRVHLGLIRNFSSIGAQLEAAGKMEIGDVVSYFWDEMQCVRAQVVWKDGDRIGLSHLHSVDTKDFPYPSRSVRVPVCATAIIYFRDKAMNCPVENLSLGGMRVRGLDGVELGARMTIEICGIEICDATLKWSKAGKSGLRFANRLCRSDLCRLLEHDSISFDQVLFEENIQQVAAA